MDDDDAVFTDMEFVFPFADYDAAGVNLVIWGDPQRVTAPTTSSSTPASSCCASVSGPAN